jgi:DNA gyrase/topoisomerase IV subunit A
LFWKIAPKSAKYTSHTIQSEILQVMTSKVRDKIREDIRDTKFCIIVDEARDESKREPMAIVLDLLTKMVLYKNISLILFMLKIHQN